jgi:vacuolar protein 8
MGLSNLFYRICCCGGEPPRAPSVQPTDLTPVARSRDSIYDPVLADSEREAVADLLGFLENVPLPAHITTPPTY